MKVLFYCHLPFQFAHGGAQIQIEQTKAGLERIGVTVEPLRWWDETQSGDILHYFGRIPVYLVGLAHNKGIKVVMTDLLTAIGSRANARLWLEACVRRVLQASVPAGMLTRLDWESYRLADACVANTPWEASLMHRLYGAPRQRIHTIPNGVEGVFFESQAAKRGRWLVCTATITGRKGVLELAEAAVLAQTPLWVIGKPYGTGGAYAEQFVGLVKRHPTVLRYEGAITDRSRLAQAYREARGFVLLSTMETRSLSAEEAAACECPLLLSDLAWARDVFADRASYCTVPQPARDCASVLRRFYDEAPRLKTPAKPLSWVDVARQIEAIYRLLLESKPAR